MKITSLKTRHQNDVTKIFHFQVPLLAKSWLHSWFHATSIGDMGQGCIFPPLKLIQTNQIIRALNSSIKVKICVVDLYFWRNLLIQDLLLKPIIISDPCAFAFFRQHSLTSYLFWLHLCKWKIFGQIVSPSPLKQILFFMAMFHALFQQFWTKFFKLLATVYFFKYRLSITYSLIFSFSKCHRNGLFL